MTFSRGEGVFYLFVFVWGVCGCGVCGGGVVGCVCAKLPKVKRSVAQENTF